VSKRKNKGESLQRTFWVTRISTNPDKHIKGDLLIITHTDLDGLISAFLLANAVADQYKHIDIIFSQPYFSNKLVDFLGSISLREYTHFALLDLSVDYTDPNSTLFLFEKLAGRLKYLFDHHSGWDKLLKKHKELKDCEIIINKVAIASPVNVTKHINVDTSELCCANLIFNFFKDKLNSDYFRDILDVAFIADDLVTRKNMMNTNAFSTFIKLANKSIEECLTTLLKNGSVRDFTGTEPNWYSLHLAEARKALQTSQEVYPGICYIRGYSSTHIHYTSLCQLAYDKYKIVIIKELDAKNQRIIFIIAHSVPHLDLTEVFKLKGGNPRRVSLYSKGTTVTTIVNKLKKYLMGKQAI